MDFVNDIDFEPGAGWPVNRILPQVPDVVHAVVAGAIDLDDIQILAGVDRDAAVALETRFYGRAFGLQAV